MLVIARIDFGSWLRRVVTWDGLLPAVIWLAPSVVEFFLPNRRGAIEIAAVVLPIAAVFLRFRAGMRHIASNRCSGLVRGVQVAIFIVGILPLVLFDCFMILSHVMPAQGGPMPAEDVIIWSVLLSIYVAAMAIAMYPGRLIDDPYRASIESPTPSELEGQHLPPRLAHSLRVLILCIICAAFAAVLPGHALTRYLLAICGFACGVAVLGFLVGSVRTHAVARKSDNRRLDQPLL